MRYDSFMSWASFGMKRRGARVAMFAALVCGYGVSESTAHASPEFPAALRSALDMPCTPVCTICHNTPDGGKGTVGKHFGQVLWGRGLVPGDPSSVKKAVDSLRAADPTTASALFDALSKDIDPNLGEPYNACGPSYGCGASVAARSSRSDSNWIVVLAAALGIALVCARRSRSSRTH